MNATLPLEHILEQWPLWQCCEKKPLLIEHFPSGLTNQIYHLQAEHRHLVLRINTQSPENLGVYRQSEQCILGALAPRGIAPKLLYSDKEFRYTVLEYQPGEILDSIVLPPAYHNAIKQIIDSYQQVDIADLPSKHYPNYIAHYWEQIEDGKKTTELRQAWSRFYQEATAFQHSGWVPVLTHHDLTPANIVINKGKLTILDWEYATLGHPEIDMYTATGLPPATPFIKELMQWINKLWFMLPR